jgi:hypothetical protein
MVAERYQEASGETFLRDGPDLRRHFIQKLCNRGIKPTGNAGETNGVTKRAQEIYESILVKESVANFGANDDDDEDDFEEGDEEEDQEDDIRAPIQAEFDLTLSRTKSPIWDFLFFPTVVAKIFKLVRKLQSINIPLDRE